jgi:hypothetical protein
MMTQINPAVAELTEAGIRANISYYEALVQNSKDQWEQHLQVLQFWIEQLERKDNRE